MILSRVPPNDLTELLAWGAQWKAIGERRLMTSSHDDENVDSDDSIDAADCMALYVYSMDSQPADPEVYRCLWKAMEHCQRQTVTLCDGSSTCPESSQVVGSGTNLASLVEVRSVRATFHS